MNRIIGYLFALAAILIISGCATQPKAINVEIIPETNDQSAPIEPKPAAEKKSTSVPAAVTAPAPDVGKKKTVEIPGAFSMDIAFAPQAPFRNWDAVHEEACEEASMIMVDKYFKRQPLTEQIMEDELQKLLKWEEAHGYKVDLTAQETVDVLKSYFGISSRLSRSVSADQIKYELSQGRPVIIPAAGRLLGNPYFTGEGPLYHMLVIKGYNSSQFITNDPGTRRGDGYAYSFGALINAIHDWNPDLAGNPSEAEMAKGESVIIVVDK